MRGAKVAYPPAPAGTRPARWHGSKWRELALRPHLRGRCIRPSARRRRRRACRAAGHRSPIRRGHGRLLEKRKPARCVRREDPRLRARRLRPRRRPRPSKSSSDCELAAFSVGEWRLPGAAATATAASAGRRRPPSPACAFGAAAARRALRHRAAARWRPCLRRLHPQWRPQARSTLARLAPAWPAAPGGESGSRCARRSASGGCSLALRSAALGFLALLSICVLLRELPGPRRLGTRRLRLLLLRWRPLAPAARVLLAIAPWPCCWPRFSPLPPRPRSRLRVAAIATVRARCDRRAGRRDHRAARAAPRSLPPALATAGSAAAEQRLHPAEGIRPSAGESDAHRRRGRPRAAAPAIGAASSSRGSRTGAGCIGALRHLRQVGTLSGPWSAHALRACAARCGGSWAWPISSPSSFSRRRVTLKCGVSSWSSATMMIGASWRVSISISARRFSLSR
jgi:hypothetical protein